MYNSIQYQLIIPYTHRFLRIQQLRRNFNHINKMTKFVESYANHRCTRYKPKNKARLGISSHNRIFLTNISDFTQSSETSPAMVADFLEDGTMRSTLYEQLSFDGHCDETVRQLNNCNDYKEIFKTIEECQDTIHNSHLIYSVFLLFYLYRDPKSTLKLITADRYFKNILKRLHSNIESMTINQLSCCYLYLYKIGLENSSKIMKNLLLRALDIVASGNDIPLPALSRLIVAIKSSNDFHTPTVCINFPSRITNLIKKCTTAEDARLLSICLVHLHQLAKHEILDDFKGKVKQLIKDDVISASSPKCVLKILHMLSMPFWSHRNTHLIRDLMILIQPNIYKLTEFELRLLVKIFQSQLEPSSSAELLKNSAKRYLDKNPTPDTLACYIQFSEAEKRDLLIALLKQMLTRDESWQLPNASSNFFISLRSLKISDVKLCHAFWSGILKEIGTASGEDRKFRILRYCHWYMNFNNNLGGTYRHLDLERALSKTVMHLIEEDIAGLIPETFARLSAFILAYGHTNFWNTQFPNAVITKIFSMRDQFSIIDCLHMSRGLQIACEIRYRNYNFPPLTAQLTTLENVFTECAQRHLSQDNLGPAEINSIVRSLNSRKSSKRTLIYNEALSKYKKIDCNILTSRTIRDIAHNLSTSNFIIPVILESMFKYIKQNRKYVLGDTVEKVLTCAYSLGYTPESLDIEECAAQIVLRHFDQMSGLSIVKACLALCYYKSMPEELISKIFCVNFIKRIEDEIQTCYSKATYPGRVLNWVMQLNRTICLDFPEANVPWFQQTFIEAQLSEKSRITSKFSEDVKQFLKAVLKDETYFRCNHITPYGYRIDFVIHFDKYKKPIPAPVETAMLDRITKVAILLLKLDAFCENDLNFVHGEEALKMKHLEMMGYKVLQININDWNSKYMTAPGAKENYIKCLLKISNGDTQSAIKVI